MSMFTDPDDHLDHLTSWLGDSADQCLHCATWGKSGLESDGFIIKCPKCGRFTWPNLGVNMPAGAANSFYTMLNASESRRVAQIKEMAAKKGWIE